MVIKYERKDAKERKLDILKALVGEGFITAGRVGRLVGLSRTQARNYLLKLESEGKIIVHSSYDSDTGKESVTYAILPDLEEQIAIKYFGVHQERF